MKITPNERTLKIINYIYNNTLLETGSQEQAIIKATTVAYGIGMQAGQEVAEYFSDN